MALSNEEAYKKLRSRLLIDPLRLDQEWLELPSTIQEAMEFAMESVQLRDAAKNALAYQEAEAARTLRNRTVVSSKGGEPKQRSEAQIQSEVRLEDNVQQAIADYEDCKYDAALWLGLVDSLREKSGALKKISELITSGFLTSAGATASARAVIHEQRTTGIARRPIQTG